ncbi:MAG: DUF6166 domain-containing protein [Pirellulales bacterium]
MAKKTDDGPARHESGAIARSAGEVRYMGERLIHAGVLVVRSCGDDKVTLDERRDLAPALPVAFDWGHAGSRARADRLAIAILADALADRAHGDEFALRYHREYAREVLDRQPDAFFDVGAWAAARWVAEREDTRQPATSRLGLHTGSRVGRTA